MPLQTVRTTVSLSTDDLILGYRQEGRSNRLSRSATTQKDSHEYAEEGAALIPRRNEFCIVKIVMRGGS